MTAPLQNLCAAVCGDGGAGRVHAPTKMEGAVCNLYDPSVRSSRTQKCGRTERSILVQEALLPAVRAVTGAFAVP